ncbi:MAG: LAGLIDADG family homing endonuclease [Candidatus Woesearchaeota archaeon]
MKDIALLYGLLLGDGCLSRIGKGWYVILTLDIHSDKELIDIVLKLLSKIRTRDTKVNSREEYGKYEISFSDKALFNRLNSLGFPIGKKGINLIIPDCLEQYMKEVIMGYFATDGCLVITNNNGTEYPRIEFSSISKPLLEQVKDYLNSKKIEGKIYLSHKAKGKWNNLYRLQINGKNKLISFENNIGLLNPKHQMRFQLITTIL